MKIRAYPLLFTDCRNSVGKYFLDGVVEDPQTPGLNRVKLLALSAEILIMESIPPLWYPCPNTTEESAVCIEYSDSLSHTDVKQLSFLVLLIWGRVLFSTVMLFPGSEKLDIIVKLAN